MTRKGKAAPRTNNVAIPTINHASADARPMRVHDPKRLLVGGRRSADLNLVLENQGHWWMNAVPGIAADELIAFWDTLD